MDLLDLSPHPLFMILFIIQGLYNQFRGAGAFTSLFGAGLAFVAPLMAFVVYAWLDETETTDSLNSKEKDTSLAHPFQNQGRSRCYSVELYPFLGFPFLLPT